MYAVDRIDTEIVDDNQPALLCINICPPRKWLLGHGARTRNFSGNCTSGGIFSNVIIAKPRRKNFQNPGCRKNLDISGRKYPALFEHAVGVAH
jgi:hypothetical protein